jgi:hypothetical protein
MKRSFSRHERRKTSKPGELAMFGSLSASHRPASRRSFRPQLEALEGRDVPSGMATTTQLVQEAPQAQVSNVRVIATPTVMVTNTRSFQPQLEALKGRDVPSGLPAVTQVVPAIVTTQQVANQNQLAVNNLKQDLEKTIPGGPIQVRNGPVGSAPKTQREQEREDLERMKAMPVTRPPDVMNTDSRQIRPVFRTGSEQDTRPAEPPKGWHKIEVFGPPKGNSTIAEKVGTFYRDPATGRMIRWS